MTPSLRGAVLALAFSLLVLTCTGSQAQQADEPPSSYPGMVDIPDGTYKIGIDKRWFERAWMKRKKDIPPDLRKGEKLYDFWWWTLHSETPEHEVKQEAYSIGKFPVTNAQYKVFLDECCRETKYISDKRNDIFRIAEETYGESPDEWQVESIYWLNREKLDGIKDKVYEANKDLIKQLLDAFNQDRPDPAKVKDFDELAKNSRKERVKGWVRFKLPKDVALTVYTKVVPKHWAQWPSDEAERPLEEAKGEKGRFEMPSFAQLALPVVWVSGVDADDYAHWAGQHVQTEQEYEIAARGPKGFLYPWGDEWKWTDREQKNWLLWREAEAAPRGPAHPNRDRPCTVNHKTVEKGVSGFGIWHALGNTMEWTSSVPMLYPRSEAEKKRFLGKPGYRVLRSQAWGSGKTYKDFEITIRNTARIILSSEKDGIVEEEWMGAVGFRTAKYRQPTRDVMMHRLKKLKGMGILPEGIELEAARAFGVELTDYTKDTDEADGFVFVNGPTRMLSVVPLPKLDFATTKDLLRSAEGEEGNPVALGLIDWNGDLEVELLVLEKQEVVPEVDPNAETADPNGGGKKEDPPSEEEKKEDPPADGEKKEGEDEPADQPGDQPGPAPAEPVKKVFQIVEVRKFVGFDPEKFYLLGIDKGRLAFCELKFTGPKTCAYLPIQVGSEEKPVLAKGDPKEMKPYVRIEPGKGQVHYRLALPTRSATAKEVFLVEFTLKIRAAKKGLTGSWQAPK